MPNTIGIRREDLSKKGEKRVALVPQHAEKLTQAGHRLLVQPAIHPDTKENKRAFPDLRYEQAGAEISEDLTEAQVIFGLKEIDPKLLEEGKTYLFFSHTHKGQRKNRRMLRTLVKQKATAIDYELITDAQKRRVVTAFTYFAGYAGMIDSLWALGQRLSVEGIMNPFYRIPQAIEKEDLGMIKSIIRAVGGYIQEHGTPEELPPPDHGLSGKWENKYRGP
jgi:alpha-aminoadipic semialdehyde synthase